MVLICLGINLLDKVYEGSSLILFVTVDVFNCFCDAKLSPLCGKIWVIVAWVIYVVVRVLVLVDTWGYEIEYVIVRVDVSIVVWMYETENVVDGETVGDCVYVCEGT